MPRNFRIKEITGFWLTHTHTHKQYTYLQINAKLYQYFFLCVVTLNILGVFLEYILQNPKYIELNRDESKLRYPRVSSRGRPAESTKRRLLNLCETEASLLWLFFYHWTTFLTFPSIQPCNATESVKVNLLLGRPFNIKRAVCERAHEEIQSFLFRCLQSNELGQTASTFIERRSGVRSVVSKSH